MTGMIQALRGRLDGQRPGQSLVILAASLTVLMGMTALSVDAGNLWLQQRLLQNLADGAALVGAQEYDNTDPANPRLSANGPDSALTYIQRGGIACTSGATGPDCAINCSVFADPAVCKAEVLISPTPMQYIQVEVSRTVPFAFARILGFNQQRLTARATARIVRQTPSGAAIVALGDGAADPCTGSTSGVSVCGGDTNDRYRVRGDVVSHSTINGVPSMGTIYIEEGGAIATTGITANVFPSPGLVDPGTPSRYPDPIELERSALGITLPTLPSSGSCPGGRSPIFDGGGNLIGYNITGGNIFINDMVPGLINYFQPGDYCTIEIRCGVAKFNDGVYRISSPVAPAYFKVLPDSNTSICPYSPDVDLTMLQPKATSLGIYIIVQREIELINETHFDLKGRSEYLDILFHSDPAGVGLYGIALDNTVQSQAIGSIYAPNGRVTIRGNACDDPVLCGPTARVTRGQSCFGCSSLTQRGGRVVARRVDLILDPSPAGNSWGVDFPPYTTQLGFVPVLVPNPPNP